jgi:hypothetical protein
MEFVKSKVGKDPASIVAEFLMPSKKKVLKHYENVMEDIRDLRYCNKCGIAKEGPNICEDCDEWYCAPCYGKMSHFGGNGHDTCDNCMIKAIAEGKGWYICHKCRTPCSKNTKTWQGFAEYTCNCGYYNGDNI